MERSSVQSQRERSIPPSMTVGRGSAPLRLRPRGRARVAGLHRGLRVFLQTGRSAQRHIFSRARPYAHHGSARGWSSRTEAMRRMHRNSACASAWRALCLCGSRPTCRRRTYSAHLCGRCRRCAARAEGGPVPAKLAMERSAARTRERMGQRARGRI